MARAKNKKSQLELDLEAGGFLAKHPIDWKKVHVEVKKYIYMADDHDRATIDSTYYKIKALVNEELQKCIVIKKP